jgi:Asp-tRNA(Asn)/Glu-tRNA(Gln) amidotransferase A subunit family amidase
LTASVAPVSFLPRRLVLAAFVVLTLLAGALAAGAATARAAAPVLDLEHLSGAEEAAMLAKGEVTSVQLVEAYAERITALNKAGPGLNAVTQINPDAIAEAEKADALRLEGKSLGPAMGLPILLKDIIDATPMYTSAGDWALRESFPEKDSGVAKQLRAHGVVILGKLGLSEWANSFGSQPSGFSNLTGQVLNANDMAQGPSGSSSGSGAAGDAALSALTIGTETSGSIISPSNAQSLIGLRPTLGLVPGYGIAPILASQDTAGPMVRTVTDAAMTLQSIAEIPGADPEANAEYEGIMGPEWMENGDITPAPYSTLPNYMDALDLNFVNGKRIGYNGNECTPQPSCTPSDTQKAVQKAKEILEAAGAIMVPDAAATLPTLPALPPNYEAHATIDSYYAHLGESVPLHNLVEEVASDDTNPQEGEKDGISTHRRESLVPLRGEGVTGPNGKPEGTENAEAYEKVLPERKAIYHAAIEGMMNNPSGGGGPVIAVLGSVPSGPQAGLPQIAVPMGYSPSQRRNVGVSLNGGAYDEFDLLGVAYVLEQGTKLRKGVGDVNPAAYRCAHTAIPAPYAERGHCNPDYQATMDELGGEPTVLPFSLETTSATELEKMMEEGELTAEELVKAELTRLALTNARGISTQSVRALAPAALEEAEAADVARAEGDEGPLLGIPVLVDDSIDLDGLATSGGSIALQDNLPSGDSTLVAKLKAAGAILLGDTNTSELGGVMEGSTMPQGYSSLGGQALLPADTNKNVGGSSGGSAGAVSMGLSPLAIGIETSPEASRAIVPAENAGLVAIKPTVGLVSRAGVMPTARSQESPTPMAQSVADVAAQLDVLAGPDPADPVTETQPSPVPDYSVGLSPTALVGDKVATVAVKATPSERSAAEQAYVAATEAATSAGATTEVVTPGTAATAASVVPYEFHRDLDSFLAATPGGGAESLQGVIEYNKAHPVEGLKFGQAGLIAAQATSIGGEQTTYEANLATGRTESKTVIDNALTGGRVALMVPSGSALVAIADRAGYPVLTLPAGFGLQDSSTGGDPIGVDLIGTSYSEVELLADAYALEAKLEARQQGPAYMRIGAIVAPQFSGVPSMTNPSMFRCTPGSAYYNPYDCNPEVVELHGNPPSGGGTGQGGGGGAETTPPESPAPPAPKPEVKPGKTAKLLPGKGTAILTVQVSGPGKLVLSGVGVKKVTAHPKKAGPVKLTVKAVGGKAKTLAKTGKVTVHLKLVFTAADGTTVKTAKTVVLKKKT